MSEDGISKYVPKRGAVKKLGKRIFSVALATGLAYTLTAGVYGTKTIYKVKTNYAVVLEKFSGERTIVKDVGWHGRAPFFTKFEKEISLMQREMYLNGDKTPQTIVSSDKISLLASGLLTYKVVDPYKWGIEIQNAEGLLQKDYDGMAKDVIQGSPEAEIIHKRETLKNRIFHKLKTQPINTGEGFATKTLEGKYGIELVSFNLTNSEYPKNLAEASQRKKELELIADGEQQAILRTYQGHTEGVKKFMEATGLSKEEAVNYLNQQRWASAYEKSKDQKTFVINNGGNNLGINLPTQEDKTKKLEEKIQSLEEDVNKLDYTKSMNNTTNDGNPAYSNPRTKSPYNPQVEPKTNTPSKP